MLSRRRFLASLSGAILAGSALPVRHAISQGPQIDKSSKPYRVIDTHFHLFNTTLQGTHGVPQFLRVDGTIEAGVEAMRRGGIDRAYLITYNAQDIAPQFRQNDTDPALLRRVYNTQYQLQAFQKHPELFWWFPDHVDPLRETYLEDLERDFENGASGIKLLPVFHGFLPDHPGFTPVYEMCQKRGKPVILDCSWWYFSHMPAYNEVKSRRTMLKRYADYARLMGEIFRAFPAVPFSLAHTGATRDVDEYLDVYALIADHPNVSCDIAASTGYSARFVEQLVKAVGAERVMYGTDWPYWSLPEGPDSYRKEERRWTMITDDCPSLDERQKRLILAENADRFAENKLPFDAPAERVDSSRTSRSTRLHRDCIVIVMHDHNPIEPDVDLMRAGGVTAKVYQLLVDVDIGPDFRATADRREGWTKQGLAAIEDVHRTVRDQPERLLVARTAADFEEAKRLGKVAVLIGVEGAKILEGKLENLRTFYELGLRELQLRWAVPNQIVEHDTLTAFGISVVRECQKLGLIVDLTHIPQRAFYECIELMEQPPVISHGTAAGAGVDRDDRSLKALASRDGVLGIHFYSSYLGPKPTVQRVVEQVDYVSQLVGIDTVGLGVDLFPTSGKWGEFQRAQGTTEISWAVESLGQMQRVTDALVARGYADDDIRKILGGNFLRVCREVLGS